VSGFKISGGIYNLVRCRNSSFSDPKVNAIPKCLAIIPKVTGVSVPKRDCEVRPKTEMKTMKEVRTNDHDRRHVEEEDE